MRNIQHSLLNISVKEVKLTERTVSQIDLPYIYHSVINSGGSKRFSRNDNNKVITCNPDLKRIFQDPPTISSRQTPNIQDKVVQANH